MEVGNQTITRLAIELLPPPMRLSDLIRESYRQLIMDCLRKREERAGSFAVPPIVRAGYYRKDNGEVEVWIEVFEDVFEMEKYLQSERMGRWANY